MTEQTRALLSTALQLSVDERAELLASLDGEPDADIEAAWAAEISFSYPLVSPPVSPVDAQLAKRNSSTALHSHSQVTSPPGPPWGPRLLAAPVTERCA